MCVILHRLPGNEVSQADLSAAYCHNSDGCGLMFLEDGKLVVQKGLWSKAEMLEKVAALGDREYCLHLRIKTHGKVDENNCHPFPIWSNVALMHNGILSIKTPNQDFSDTWHFAQCLRKFKVGPWIHLEENLKTIEEFHGTGNRMCFMSPAGVERTGNWDEHAGNFWSNLYWQPLTRTARHSSYYYDGWEEDYDLCATKSDGWVDKSGPTQEDTCLENGIIDCPECGERNEFPWGDFAFNCLCCSKWWGISYPTADTADITGEAEASDKDDLICLPHSEEELWDKDDDEFVCGRDRLA